MAQKVSHY